MKNEVKIKEKIKERYDKIAFFGNSDSCCSPIQIAAVQKKISILRYPLQQNQMVIIL
jgi:hypothetical protein